MANKKKEVNNKDVLEQENNQEEIKQEEIKQEKKVKKMTKRDISRDMEVRLMNNTNGLLVVKDKNGVTYTLPEYGDVEYFTVGDLLFIKNDQKSTLLNGWGVILDEEYDGAVIDFLGLKHTYEKLHTKESMKTILGRNTKKLQETLENVSNGLASNMVDLAVLLAKENDSAMESANIRKVFIDYTGKKNLFDFE